MAGKRSYERANKTVILVLYGTFKGIFRLKDRLIAVYRKITVLIELISRFVM